MTANALGEVLDEEGIKARIEKVNVKTEEVDIASEKGGKLVAEHSIMSVPTTIIDGEVSFSGSRTRTTPSTRCGAPCARYAFEAKVLEDELLLYLW